MSDDARVKRDINRLVEPPRPPRTLPERAAVAPIPAGVGIARPVLRGGASTGTGDGIASPLTEVSRTLHATQAISSDGLFAYRVPHVIDFEDANQRPVQMVFAAPL